MNTPPPAANIPLINPSPKQRFLANPPSILSKHREMVSSQQFDHSSDFALAEMVRELVEHADGNQYYAMAAFLRIQGAVEYLGQLKRLAEPVQLPTHKYTEGNLKHGV